MRILFAGHGPVADSCRKILASYGQSIRWEDFAYANPAEPWDLLMSVHWKDKIDKAVLSQMKYGGLNLHNSYLPWNKGADACTWAIIDKTPHGATMHWMNDGFDDGDIFVQFLLDVRPYDTTDTLYKRTAELEVKLFGFALEEFMAGNRVRIPQVGNGTRHYKKDFERLERAMTTNRCRVIHV